MRIVYREEGVSEVIGTILVLAITVVLFTTVFVYVQHIPSAQKSAQISIIPNFIVTNGSLYITLNDKSGTPLDINNTYFSVMINGTVYSSTLAGLASQVNSGLTSSNGYFNAGNILWWNSTGRGITITQNTTYGALIFSKQYNQIMWQSQNYFTSFLNSFGIISAYTSPYPIIPSQYFDIFVQVYSTSFANATYVYGNISTLNGSRSLDNVSFLLLSGQGNIKTYYTSLQAPSFIPSNASARIIASSLGQKRYDNLTLSSSTGVNPILSIPANGVTFQNSEPLHGSNDIVSVIVRNNGSVGAAFMLTVKDLYPSGNSQYIESNYANGVNTTFEVGAYSSSSIEFVWINVGGPSPTSGRNILNFSLYNITGVNGIKEPNLTPARDVYVYIMPKILLVNEEGVPSGSSQDVYNYYYTAFEYNNYQPTSIGVSQNEQVNLGGYDVVVWFTGNSTQGISSNQLTTIYNFYSNGGKVFLISGASATYTSSGGISELVPNTQNVTFNSRSMGFDPFKATAVNYSSMNQNFETNFGGMLQLTPSPKPFINMTFNGINYTIGYSGTNSKQGRVVVVGFEMARLELYQMDFAIDKIMLWLSNVTVGSGNQLVLSDIRFSTSTPLFDQNVSVSFIITNLSPIPFNDVTLEVLINNQVYQFIEGISVQGDGNFTMVNFSWVASPPGKSIITGIVDPFHEIPQVNYALDVASSLVNTTITVRYTALLLWVHEHSDQYAPTGLNATLKQLNIHSDFLNYVETSSTGSITEAHLIQNFTSHNLIIIDMNNSGYTTPVLLTAINAFLTKTYVSPNIYSIAILGINAGVFDGTNVSQDLGVNIAQTTATGSYQYLNGTVYDGTNQLVNVFSQNATRGYGIVYGYVQPQNQLEVTVEVTNPSINYAPLFETNSTNPYYSIPWDVYWSGIIENVSGIRVAILPIDWENIVGLLQNHTNAFSPVTTFGSSSLYAKYYLMLNLAISLGYVFTPAFPEVLSPDISINSAYISLNNHYIVSGLVRNLGATPTTVVVQLFEQNALEETQTVYLPGESTIPIQYIWDPSYASSPKPEPLRLVIFNPSVRILPALEAIDPVQTYYFFDDGSTLQNWNHYNVLAYITGEALFGLTNPSPSTTIVTTFGHQNYTSTNSDPHIANKWVSYTSFSYPNSYYIKDVINYGRQSLGDYSSVELTLPTTKVNQGETLTLSWEWKYSIATAQNGLFLMVEVGNNWYQVSLPYNSNPDLGNLITVNGALIDEVYNGESGGGTFAWTYHSINTNELYVMNPSTGLPEPSPMNVFGQQVTFAFFYISPEINAHGASGQGSNVPGNGSYIDNVMLSATNGGNDGWKVISPGETHQQYGISSNGVSYLGFAGSPTKSLIAMYDNVSFQGSSGYPTFTDGLWDNLVSPIVDLYNAINASFSMTFKANIAQGLYGDGWPPDYFTLSISSNYGSTWEQLYSPPTYPTAQYGNGGQAGGGTVYATSSTNFYPANGANSTYWLKVPINLNFFLGLPIYFDFSMITTKDPSGGFDLFSPWHAVGYNSVSQNPFLGFYMTNIFVQGYSQSPYVSFSGTWM